MNIYPTDAYTGRQPKGEVKIKIKTIQRTLKADVNLVTWLTILLNHQILEDSDLDLINAIDNNLVNPKDFNNIEAEH